MPRFEFTAPKERRTVSSDNKQSSAQRKAPLVRQGWVGVAKGRPAVSSTKRDDERFARRDDFLENNRGSLVVLRSIPSGLASQRWFPRARELKGGKATGVENSTVRQGVWTHGVNRVVSDTSSKHLGKAPSTIA